MVQKIGFFIGSLRKDSINKVYAQAIAQLLPQEYEPVFLELGSIPAYNEDNEDNSIEAVTRLRAAVDEVEGFVFVIPEYNRSVPGFLKNAIDTLSRPWGSTRMFGKPTLIASTSTGPLGGFGANHDLRQMLVFFNAPVVAQPELYIGSADTYIQEDGSLAEDTTALLQKAVDSFVKLMETFSK